LLILLLHILISCKITWSNYNKYMAEHNSRPKKEKKKPKAKKDKKK